MSRFRLLAPALLFVAACAGTPTYGPVNSGSGNFGFSDQRIETDRYRISYRGETSGSASDGALRRAAELTRLAGYDYFIVTERDATFEQGQRGGPRVGIGGGDRHWGGGVSIPLGQGQSAVVTNLEIIMVRGPKPATGESYNAQEVLANLGG